MATLESQKSLISLRFCVQSKQEYLPFLFVPGTSSSHTSHHSLPRKLESSFVTLLLLSPRGKPRGDPDYAPQAAGFSSGLSAAPQAAGASAGLSPAPQAAGASVAPQAAGLSDAPQALPAVFSFQPAMFANAMTVTSFMRFVLFRQRYCHSVILIIGKTKKPASTHLFITQVTFL